MEHTKIPSFSDLLNIAERTSLMFLQNNRNELLVYGDNINNISHDSQTQIRKLTFV